MNKIMTLTGDAQTIGSIDISDPEGAFEEMLRASHDFAALIALGDCRNYVTVRRGEVLSVVFYDCFWEAPETREEQTFRDMVNAICEIASSSARLVCRTYDEYIAAVNSCGLYEVNVLHSISMSED